MNPIKFMITDKQYIHVMPETIKRGDCAMCAECDVVYVDEEKGLTIRFGSTEAETFNGAFGFEGFNDLLSNKLVFDNDKLRDPGFEYNQYCQDLIKNTDVIDKYFFESNSNKNKQPFYASWFYNDKSGNIIFEISPLYPWFNVDDAARKPGFITYEDFMKNYKVTIHKIIPKETLMHWNKQAKSYDHTCDDF